MSGSRGERVSRATALLLAGALAASAVSSSVAAAPSSMLSTTYTRAASCQGLSFHPVDTLTGFGYTSEMMLFRDDTMGGSGFFVCDPGLPNRAVVTKVQFTVRDPDPHADILYCGLYRAGLTPDTVGTVQELASVSPTGIGATPGTVRKTDSTIKHATVDNTSWGYELQCKISQGEAAPEPDTAGIFGASVIYTISSTNG